MIQYQLILKGQFMHFKKFILVSLLTSTTLLFSQSTLALNVNDEDFELEGAIDIAAFSEYSNGTTYMINANFINTEIESLANIGLNANNSFQGVEGLNLSLGLNMVYLEDYWAFPLMAKASYALPLIEEIPTISLSAKVLYAPSVLSFDEAEDYLEFRTEAGMEVINAVSVYVGYRNIEAVYYDIPQKSFNDSFYGGLKIGF